MVACTNEHCLEQVKRKDLEQHVTITCAWRIIECEYCEEPHPRRHLQVNKAKNNRPYFPLRVFCKMPLWPSTTDFNRRDEYLFRLIFDLDVWVELFTCQRSAVDACGCIAVKRLGPLYIMVFRKKKKQKASIGSILLSFLPHWMSLLRNTAPPMLKTIS